MRSTTARGLATLAVLTGAVTVALPALPASATTICITAVVLPVGQPGSPYQVRITTDYTGTSRLNMTASGLPAGLTMSTSGSVTGAPTTAGVYHPTFSVGTIGCSVRTLPLTVTADPHAIVTSWYGAPDSETDPAEDVPGLTDITSLGYDDHKGVFLRGDGTVWTWIQDNETAATSSAPVQLTGLSGITQVAGDGGPTTDGIKNDGDAGFALRYDGTVWSWGDNTSGQLGNGTIGGQDLTPTKIAGLSNVVAISSGVGYAYALTADGQVWGWGREDTLLFNGPWNVSQPIKVLGMTNMVAIATASFTAYGLRADGTVWAIGYGTYGELGQPVMYESQATKVPGLSGVSAIAAGGNDGYALAGGRVWAWGQNAEGELGIGSAAAISATPVLVSSLSGVTAIGGGGNSAYAIVPGSAMRAWGAALANGSFNSNVPVASSVSNAIFVSGSGALRVPARRLVR